jgi:hypothetical protein
VLELDPSNQDGPRSSRSSHSPGLTRHDDAFAAGREYIQRFGRTRKSSSGWPWGPPRRGSVRSR